MKFRGLIFPSMFWNGALSLPSFLVDIFYWPKTVNNASHDIQVALKFL